MGLAIAELIAQQVVAKELTPAVYVINRISIPSKSTVLTPALRSLIPSTTQTLTKIFHSENQPVN